VEARSFISKLHQRLETTFIYVTHDQVEAMTMGTRIAVLNAGELADRYPFNLYHNRAMCLSLVLWVALR
jgi:multiple sugar transport system ATP-binding protein